MLSNILSSCQAIMPQITVGGDLIVNLSGDGWAVVASCGGDCLHGRQTLEVALHLRRSIPGWYTTPRDVRIFH